MNGYVWAQKGPREWWYAQTAEDGTARLDDKTYPPRYQVSASSCLHFYRLYNGRWPGDEAGDDEDYLHICDLDEFIAELQELKAVLPGSDE